MHIHFPLVNFSVAGLEVIPYPIYVLSLLADYHSLHIFIFHQHTKLDVIDSITFRSDRLTLYEEIVRDVVVRSMKKCLFEQFLSDLELTANSLHLFGALPLSLLRHTYQVVLNLLQSVASQRRSVKNLIEFAVFLDFADQPMKLPLVFD
jgi:hypothetical protein